MGMTRRYCKGKRAASLVGVFARGPGPPCEINDLVACVCELTGARVLCCFAIGGAQHIGGRLLESTGGLSAGMRSWEEGHLKRVEVAERVEHIAGIIVVTNHACDPVAQVVCLRRRHRRHPPA